MRTRVTAVILALAGLLVAVAVGFAANSIASRSFTPGADALPSAGSLAPRANLGTSGKATTAAATTTPKPKPKPKPATTPTTTATTTATTPDDHGGGSSGSSGNVSSGKGSGSGSSSHGGKGGDD
jgi:uncharacterized membrane protein YgcG